MENPASKRRGVFNCPKPTMNASKDSTPAGRLHDLLRPEVLAAFDRAFFEREGYWVWEGILTNAGQQRWTASLQKLQQMNDALVVGTD